MLQLKFLVLSCIWLNFGSSCSTDNECAQKLSRIGEDSGLGCLCDCGSCMIGENNDIITFDGLLYQFDMENDENNNCAYDYLLSCNDDHSSDNGLPFDISGIKTNEENSIWITFYDNYEEKVFIIKLSNEQQRTQVTFEYPSVLQGDNLEYNKEYNIDRENNWFFMVKEGGREIVALFHEIDDSEFYFNHNDDDDYYYDLSISLNKISLSKCFNSILTCGLCGTWNNNKNDDLAYYNNLKLSYININNDKNKTEDKNDINIFGNSWLNCDNNKDKSGLQRDLLQSEDTTCFLIDPELCDNSPCDCNEDRLSCAICIDNGCDMCNDTYFKKEYYYKCEQCQETFGTDCEFCNDFTGCGSCAHGERLLDPVTGLYYCLCDNWKQPSHSPTNSPSPYPTFYPSNNPTFTPTNVPTDYPHQLPTYYPSNNPTFTPTNAPSNNPSKQPSNYPTTLPSKNPTTSVPTNTPISIPTIQIQPTNASGDTYINFPTLSNVVSSNFTDNNKISSQNNETFPIWLIIVIILAIIVLIGIIGCYLFGKRKQNNAKNDHKVIHLTSISNQNDKSYDHNNSQPENSINHLDT